MSVRSSQRHTKAHRCPVCGGADQDPRGADKRCFGFTSADGEYTHCSREELAGAIDQGPDQCFAHRMHGPCRCGSTHGEAKSGTTSREEFEATYDYRDLSGRLVFQVVRRPGKRFLQRQPDGAGGWVWNLKGVSRWLYRTPDVLKADPTTTVHVVEGEKDADTLWKLGLVATCNPGGAGKWNLVPEDATRILAGRDVVIIADNDDVGREHAKQVRAALQGFAKSVRTFQPPPGAKDATELLEGGGGLNDLVALDEEPKPAPEVKVAADPWNLMTAEQIFAPLPPYPWIVKGLHLAPGRITLLAGSPDTGKTVVAMSLALAIASGKSVWGVHRPARKGKVLHLNGEIGSYIARERYQRLARGMSVDVAELAETLVLSNYPAAKLDDPDFEVKMVAACTGAALVVVDSLRAFSGALDEKAKEIGVALLMLARVSDKTGATIIVLHHNRKPSKDDVGRASDAISGSNSIFGGCECAFVLSKEKSGPVTVQHERSPLGRPMTDFGLRIEDIEFEGDARWGLRVIHMEAEQMARAEAEAKAARKSADEQRAAEAILETLRRFAGVFRGSKDAFRAACSIGKEPFNLGLAFLENEHRVRREGTYHSPEWHMNGGEK